MLTVSQVRSLKAEYDRTAVHEPFVDAALELWARNGWKGPCRIPLPISRDLGEALAGRYRLNQFEAQWEDQTGDRVTSEDRGVLVLDLPPEPMRGGPNDR